MNREEMGVPALDYVLVAQSSRWKIHQSGIEIERQKHTLDV
jgi:hypothetical protein